MFEQLSGDLMDLFENGFGPRQSFNHLYALDLALLTDCQQFSQVLHFFFVVLLHDSREVLEEEEVVFREPVFLEDLL